MPTATLTDGDGAGGGSSHPDVAEQKDFCFRHWQNAATSVGEGRCIQLSPGSEEERNNSASSRNHRDAVWSQTTAPLWEEPCGSPRQPHPWQRAELAGSWHGLGSEELPVLLW